MAAALEDINLRLRDETVHFLALMKRHDAILRAPHDQYSILSLGSKSSDASPQRASMPLHDE